MISSADLTMVRIKGSETLYDFSPFRLAERKGSCRLSSAMKRQMRRSDVMACSSLTYDSMKFYETGQLDKRLTIFRGCDSSKNENAAMASKKYTI